MKVTFHRTDNANASVNLSEEVEVDDDATAEEIDEELEQWMRNDVDIWWERK